MNKEDIKKFRVEKLNHMLEKTIILSEKLKRI